MSCYNSLDGGKYKITQAFFLFDTSGLPDAATIEYTQLVVKGCQSLQADSGYDYVVDVYE